MTPLYAKDWRGSVNHTYNLMTPCGGIGVVDTMIDLKLNKLVAELWMGGIGFDIGPPGLSTAISKKMGALR